MARARLALAGKWELAVSTTLVYFVLMFVVGFVPLLPLVFGGPLALGLTIFSLSVLRNTNPHLEQVFEGFKRLSVSIVACLLMILYIFLWSLLFIVPGIVVAYSYAMVFYIIADDNTILATDALRKSKQMMVGNKWKLFCLTCRFLGWIILSFLTLGVGFLWLVPYMQVSFAEFYEEVKGGAITVETTSVAV